MATRRPLVQVLGQVQELPAGDVVTGATPGSAIVAFTGDTVYRVTISDALATVSSRIQVTVCKPTTAEVDDVGWLYNAQVVSMGAGSFDVVVVAFDSDGTDTGVLYGPVETITIFYLIS